MPTTDSVSDFITFKSFLTSNLYPDIKKLGKNLVKTAYSYDNIVEAIEHKKHNWCIGVQWHPEFLITNGDKSLIKNFVSSCFK